MLKGTYLSHPCLIAKQIQVYRTYSKWARRLVDIRTNSSTQFQKIACGNSILAFDLMVTSAKAYDN